MILLWLCFDGLLAIKSSPIKTLRDAKIVGKFSEQCQNSVAVEENAPYSILVYRRLKSVTIEIPKDTQEDPLMGSSLLERL